MVIDLEDCENAHGLSHAALSRATRFTDIGLITGITKHRLCKLVGNQRLVPGRIAEDNRLNELCKLTLEKLSGFVDVENP